VSTVPAGRVERLRASLEANACEVHTVEAAGEPAGLIARLAAEAAVTPSGGDAPVVAVATGAGSGPGAGRDAGAVLDGVVDALRRAGPEPLVPDDPGWAVRLPHAAVGVTAVDVAAAAEGVVGIRSGPGLPRATSVVPPVHLCVIPGSVVEADFDAALARVAAAGLPGALTWVGGPSRTGDLEMRTTMGVHGPLRVVAVIVTGG